MVRYVSPSHLRKDENDNVVGVLRTAFEMRRQDKGLSATWVEYFAGDRSEQLVGAVPAIRASAVTVGKNSGFAVGKVGMVAKACADRNHKIRIVLSPDSDNTAHAEFRQMPRDDLELL